jgi:hypothetical protein
MLAFWSGLLIPGPGLHLKSSPQLPLAVKAGEIADLIPNKLMLTRRAPKKAQNMHPRHFCDTFDPEGGGD